MKGLVIALAISQKLTHNLLLNLCNNKSNCYSLTFTRKKLVIAWTKVLDLLLASNCLILCIKIQGEKYTSGPRYWNIPVLVNTGTFLVYRYYLIMWYLRSLEPAGVIQKLTILERKNGLVLSNTRVPVSGTWSILFLIQVKGQSSKIIARFYGLLFIPVNAGTCCTSFKNVQNRFWLLGIHTLHVHYAHTAANLNSGYSKYGKVARMHYFCTIALRTSRAVLA